jgi:hypothetical protein
MKSKFKVHGFIGSLLVIVILLAANLLMLPLFAAAGVTVANVGTVVTGAMSTESVDLAEPGLHLDDIDAIVTKMWPAFAPLDQLLRTGIKDQRRGCDAIKTRHYAVETKPFDDVVTEAVVAANQSAFDLKVGNTALYGIGQTIFINGVPGYAEGANTTPLANTDLALYVYAVDSSNNLIKVVPINGDNVTTANKSLLKTGVQDILINSTLSIGGRALSEFAVQTDPSEYVPTDDYNYCQYFASQIEISKWEQKARKEVNFATADQLELALYDYRVRREISYWKGSRNIIYPNGQKTYTCGGLTYFITNEIDWTALLDGTKPNIKPGNIDEMVRLAFSGNSGSGQRWMFIGEYLWNAMKRTEDIQKTIANKEVEYKFGLYFNKINTGDGELVLIKHPLFKSIGMGYDAAIIDVNNIGERHFEAQTIEDIDKQKLAQAKSDAKFISETSCPVVKYPATHSIIRGPRYTSLV